MREAPRQIFSKVAAAMKVAAAAINVIVLFSVEDLFELLIGLVPTVIGLKVE